MRRRAGGSGMHNSPSWSTISQLKTLLHCLTFLSSLVFLPFSATHPQHKLSSWTETCGFLHSHQELDHPLTQYVTLVGPSGTQSHWGGGAPGHMSKLTSVYLEVLGDWISPQLGASRLRQDLKEYFYFKCRCLSSALDPFWIWPLTWKCEKRQASSNLLFNKNVKIKVSLWWYFPGIFAQPPAIHGLRTSWAIVKCF